jgi:DEAD/DEAH box helicase domain-containing protein
MLPSILAKQLQQGIGDYIETTFPMTNEPFKGSVGKMINTTGAVYHEPYVAVRLPFRVASQMPTCFDAIHPAYLPYVHQEKAFERLTGDDGRSTLVATGTGSGKTECFLYPILEYCYQHRGERGIKALIIYPMNALATDQAKRIASLIYNSPELHGNVTAGMYVGGQEETPSRMMTEDSIITDRETMLNSAPDILLTNYKMLDYLLVRPKDAALWQDNMPQTLKYIAVDEFHTFDGAQGTDLACLLRRLKSRLFTRDGYLCCVGTSATMGNDENAESILNYASEVFGEEFEKDAIITEDRLTAAEFFNGVEITEFTMPTNDQAVQLERMAAGDNERAYLSYAVKCWFPDFMEDVLSDTARIHLGERLMHHSFVQAVISLTGGNYYQTSQLVEELRTHYPDLSKLDDVSVVVNSLFALISHARIGTPGKLRPFLNVQVQLWMRELRRLLARVSASNITYALSHDLNVQQAKQYLPVVNCRDCGVTGWVSRLNERQNATMTNLDAFYNTYFRADEKIAMLFPYPHEKRQKGLVPARICPECLQVHLGEDGPTDCSACGAETIEVLVPSPIQTTGTQNHKQYVCPFCGSRRGLSLMGVRSATEISASISQMFASKFNDDKKTLAFSDSVQDAAHRAGFFNSRTWRFGFRTAIQRYCADGGANQSLKDFQNGFIQYWHTKMSPEEFVSFFIAPNMTYRHAYEDLKEKRKLVDNDTTRKLIYDIEQRAKYEIMLEYGVGSNIGRTLEKSGCSILSFSNDDIREIAATVQERTVNELGTLTAEPIQVFEQMVMGYLNRLRTNGAFDDRVFDAFLLDGGKSFKLSNDWNRWLPGLQSGRNTPRFIVDAKSGGRRNYSFDAIDSRKYTAWIESCCLKLALEDESTFAAIGRYIVEAAIKQGLIVALPSPADFTAYGLNKDKVYVSTDVRQMRCDDCGSLYAVSVENAEFWEGASCLRPSCGGHLEEDEAAGLGYYGKLYNAGDLARINAREHTGLLERDDREQLEIDFKRGKDTQKLWDPNVLSCTPTLEMGIDIGDLSTVILCSMPPAQAQFLQRAGRAGRKDGNALTLAVANARPHDLYFYADPMDMISGSVTPPKIFLRASAVLERQFLAFCMDAWVQQGVRESAIPKYVGVILNKLEAHPADIFPFNFLNYVQSTLSRQLRSFMQLFAGYLDEGTEEELRTFATGQGVAESPMHMKVLEAFEDLKRQRDALQESIRQLKHMIKELKAKPQDSSYDEDIKELTAEQNALMNVCRSINQKDTFNFLSDEGLLPNYAFPEAGIVLRAVLYRKEDENAQQQPITQKKKYQKMVYEYSRSASSAISEFAPNNSFYVDGRKLTIDQVDLTTAQTARWRLCPNCSHVQLEEAGKAEACCPQCGSPGWADSGQVQTMLKVQMVYSNMDYTKSLIGDETEDRTNIFYTKQLLVDVDEDHDISSAYRMDNEEFPFGYEFVKKATLREINFGESDMVGEKICVSGVEEIRKGFKICRYCGKIQPEQGKPQHAFSCKTRKQSAAMQQENYEDCLFLYREFSTEVLRLLIPATTMDASTVRTESFTAAFMLGMKEYFGNVDHLRATVCEVPVPDADYRKQYLVIYDSVPGGTGYLKQLMHNENALVEVFEKALAVLENCSCKEDPQKDGCYHCLYAYRQSQNIGNISRNTAIRILKSILSGKDHVEKIEKLANVPVNSLFDSELERRFIEAIAMMGTDTRKISVTKALVHDKEGYVLKLNDDIWEIEPQVLLDVSDGVAVKCKPDFVLWPIRAKGQRPVAVFTDGFTYHKDNVAADTLKREAIHRSGKFRVWSLSYKDVQNVFQIQGDYATPIFFTAQMPSPLLYRQTIDGLKPTTEINFEKTSAFELLIKYLETEDAEAVFAAYAKAYSMALLDIKLMSNSLAFTQWYSIVAPIVEQMNFTDNDFVMPGTFFGSYIPRGTNPHLRIYAGVAAAKMKLDRNTPISVCAVLTDDEESRTDKYEQEWNALWQFANLMQFSEEFIAVSSVGLEQQVYYALPIISDDAATPMQSVSSEDAAWNDVCEMLFDDEAKVFIDSIRSMGIPLPDEVGYELEGDSGEVLATIEIAWTGRKIAYLTEEQMSDKELLEVMGWKIVDSITVDAKLFGGDN